MSDSTDTALKSENDTKNSFMIIKNARFKESNNIVQLRYLDHLGMEALSHLRPTVGQQHRAVGVDMNQSSSLWAQIQTHDQNLLRHKTNKHSTVC